MLDHAAALDAYRSLTDMVSSLAAREPGRRVFTFLYSDRDEQVITAGQLRDDASRIAANFQARGVRPGDILPLAFDHGYDLVAAFWGAIYLGAAPTILPYISRDTQSPAYYAHVGRLARFANAALVVTTEALHSYLDRGLAEVGCRILALPSCSFDGPERRGVSVPARAPSDPPYIQFSSGTTGSPKGVILSHAALLHYCRTANRTLAVTPSDVTVGWLPLYHDMGLVNQIFEPLSLARHSVLMSPAAWLHEPHRLLTAIDRFRGTTTWMPNFAFRYCTRRIRDEQIAGVDLSSWRIVGNASEPVLLEDLQAFASRFAAYGLKATALTISYGMAEHVAGLTWSVHDRTPDVDWIAAKGLEAGRAEPADPDAAGSRPIVSCGYPIPTVTLRIVDDAGRERADREVGEIVARSPMVFGGYYARPEETAGALSGGWLQTGDLGYLADGQLYVCGRKKDLIIVGGRNLHPNHLETIATSALGEHGRFAAAFGIANPQLGTELPIVVCEMRQLPDDATCQQLRQKIREQLRQTLQVFVGDVYFVGQGWILKTTSGKINRAATRQKYLDERPRLDPNPTHTQDVPQTAATSTAIERQLVEIWETLFDQVGITVDDNFFALGGDSLLAAQLAVEMEDRFQRSLPATALLQAPTIAGLARLLDQPTPLAEETLVPLQPVAGPSHRPIFFCVHGLGGGVLGYRPLALALGSDQPFYALQAQALYGAAPIDDSIEALAARYVQQIKTLQPHGPYHLGGYCFGGIVAYEMARQLKAAADDVALVAIVEGYAPSADGRRHGLRGEWRFAVNFVRTLPFWLRDYLQLGRIGLQARTRRVIRVAGKHLLRLAGRKAQVELRDLYDDVAARPAQIQKLLEANLAAARQYSPAPYAGRLVLFRTPRMHLSAPAKDMGWSALSTEPVDVQMIPGSHTTILQEPQVSVLAEKLRAFLLASG